MNEAENQNCSFVDIRLILLRKTKYSYFFSDKSKNTIVKKFLKCKIKLLRGNLDKFIEQKLAFLFDLLKIWTGQINT